MRSPCINRHYPLDCVMPAFFTVTMKVIIIFQKIYAATLPGTPLSFGSSLSGGLDFDENGFPGKKSLPDFSFVNSDLLRRTQGKSPKVPMNSIISLRKDAQQLIEGCYLHPAHVHFIDPNQ